MDGVSGGSIKAMCGVSLLQSYTNSIKWPVVDYEYLNQLAVLLLGFIIANADKLYLKPYISSLFWSK